MLKPKKEIENWKREDSMWVTHLQTKNNLFEILLHFTFSSFSLSLSLSLTLFFAQEVFGVSKFNSFPW